ncbi:MAG: hypothetical protein ABWY11_05960 [Umezawaea sp.]
MTPAAFDIAETVRLWKDPEARWAFGRDSCPPHPAGEIALPPAGPTGTAWAHADTLSTFVLPSVSGPCFGYGSFADDRR